MSESRKLNTILFADIAGYTALMHSNEDQALSFLETFKNFLENFVPQFNGKIVQYFGDACLLSFDSTTLGVQCAMELQKEFIKEKLPIRIGMHLGEVVFTETNVFGDGVNIASRIESMGVSGSVLVSQAIRDQLKNKKEFALVSVGKFEFKNVSEPLEVFAVVNDGLVLPKRGEMKGKFKEKTSPMQLAQNALIYLGVAWVVIELFNLVILKLDLDPLIINILIIFLVFGLFITLSVSYFKGRWNKKAIILNTVIILLAIFSSGIYAMNPLLFNPSSLRIIPVIQDKNLLQDLSSLAVLPIENNLGDDEHDYLLAGMHDGLITEIGKTGTIKTISRTSMKTFTETTKTIKQIGKELEVEAILESGLYRIGQDYVLRLKIFDTRTEDILWTGEYTTSVPQLPNTLNAITEIVSKTIDKAIQVVIETHEDLSPESYEHVVKGIEFIKTFDPEQIPKALPHFHRAIELDSSNIEGYLGVAKVWIYLQQIGAVDPREARPIIFEFFGKAEALEPDHWKLLGVKSTVESLLNYEMKAGIRFGEESLKINPNNSDRRAALALFYMIVGDWDKAWYHMNYAKEIDPLNPQVIAFAGVLHLNQGNMLSVSKEISILGTIQPSNLLYRKGKLLLPFSKEKPEEAKQLLKDFFSFITIEDAELTINEFIDEKYEETQDLKETNYQLLKYLDQHINQLNTLPSSIIARTLYRELAGYDDELFFKHFQIMDQVKDPELPYMSIRDGNPLQDDPRYIAIMEKNGFW